ncbi:MAG: hypothetical protein M9951_14005 [Burkholderiaceae bacterium]|jgi:hypothetical protein|nr:hypothetical protein [Burkholderiaceae bacterium]MEB2320395.1 hypothetical protein [Pseudomonadota bacterium]
MEDIGDRPVRTALGTAELRTGRADLSPRQRQILILCDGRRRIRALARCFPEPDFAAELAELEARGFVYRGASPVMPAAPADGLASAPEDAALGTLRRRLVQACADALGDAGEAFVERIGRARSRAELRRLVPAMMAAVAATRDADAARALRERIEPL